MPFRYLLDENIDPTYKEQLLRQRSDLAVWAVGDLGAPPRGTLDPAILCWCEDNDFVLVTNNRASMPVHLIDHIHSGRHVPGILTLNSDMSIGQTVDELILIAMASSDFEYQDIISYLPLS